jgi:glycosyltransferase involved in cell wall biosynthesis
MRHDFDIRKDMPVVTVITLTYNHAPYIRQCLDSILAQETNFPVQMIVHDDASTDGTVEIVREYAEKYPNVIVPILQKENQYSKGNGLAEFILPLVKGKYRASCEGDDYWIDPLKLKKQVRIMEEHPDTTLCGAVARIEAQGPLDGRLIKPKIMKDVYALRDVFSGTMFHTSTYLVRTDIRYPAGYTNVSYGDFFTRFVCALQGKLRCLPDIVSVYRFHGKGVYSGASSRQIADNQITLYTEVGKLLDDKQAKLIKRPLLLAKAQRCCALIEEGDRNSAIGIFRAIAFPLIFVSMLMFIILVLMIFLPALYRLARKMCRMALRREPHEDTGSNS